MRQLKSPHNQRLQDLEAEVANLRSWIIGLAGKDREGNYRPEFVRSIRAAAHEPTEGQFEKADTFLKLLQAQAK